MMLYAYLDALLPPALALLALGVLVWRRWHRKPGCAQCPVGPALAGRPLAPAPARGALVQLGRR